MTCPFCINNSIWLTESEMFAECTRWSGFYTCRTILRMFVWGAVHLESGSLLWCIHITCICWIWIDCRINRMIWIYTCHSFLKVYVPEARFNKSLVLWYVILYVVYITIFLSGERILNCLQDAQVDLDLHLLHIPYSFFPIRSSPRRILWYVTVVNISLYLINRYWVGSLY